MISRSNNKDNCFQSSKVLRKFIKVRRLEAMVRNVYRTGREPDTKIINALERAQGEFLGLLNEAEEIGLPIGKILASLNAPYQE